MNSVVSNINGLFLAKTEISEFIARTASKDSSLDPHDAIRLRAFISSQYRHADNIHFQYQIGTISKSQMESLLYPVVLNFQQRGRLREEWESGQDKLLLNPDLVKYLDAEIRKIDSTSSRIER
jgi:hypothetical protein